MHALVLVQLGFMRRIYGGGRVNRIDSVPSLAYRKRQFVLFNSSSDPVFLCETLFNF